MPRPPITRFEVEAILRRVIKRYVDGLRKGESS
jgi:hypothetical protein